jgi:hypothetical protein
MATIIRIPITNEDDIHLFALSLVRIARLTMIQAPGDIMERELAIVDRRSRKISLKRDRRRIRQTIEDIVMSETTRRFGCTACLNCNAHADCPMAYMKQIVGGSAEPMEISRHPHLAAKNCPAYAPDWEGFNRFAKEYPRFISQIEECCTMKLDRNRLAQHFTVVLEHWTNAVGG